MTLALSPERLALFAGASLALTLTPGPAVLFIVARSMSLGRRVGFLSVLGIGLGNAVHAAAAALGLAALLASSPALFAAVRYAGAAYLVLLGVRRLRAPAGAFAGAQGAALPRRRAVVREAFGVAVLNPKTGLFFLAFLPQFADPARGPVAAQILLLGALFVAIAVVTDAGYVLLAGAAGAWLRRSPGFARGERYVTGAVYIGLGALAVLAG